MNINLSLAIYGMVALLTGFCAGYVKDFTLLLILLIGCLGLWILFYYKDVNGGKDE